MTSIRVLTIPLVLIALVLMLLQTIIISITSPDQHSKRQGPGSILSNVAVSGTHTAIWENYNVILLRIIFTSSLLPLFCPTLSEAAQISSSWPKVPINIRYQVVKVENSSRKLSQMLFISSKFHFLNDFRGKMSLQDEGLNILFPNSKCSNVKARWFCIRWGTSNCGSINVIDVFWCIYVDIL